MVREPESGPRPARRRIGTRAAAVAAAALLAATAACGGSGNSSSGASGGAGSVPSSGSPSPSGTAPADPAAARARVARNWQKFFSPSTPLADKAALLQNGAGMTSVLQSFARDPRVGQVQAKVVSVRFTSSDTAVVTYSLSLKGRPVLSDSTGQAVLQNGVWKIGDSTLCSLVALSGSSAATGPSASGMSIPGC